jgi:hypothetical protein
LHLALVEENKEHYEKKGNFAISLATQFLNWPLAVHCISMLWLLLEKLHELLKLQLIIYMMQFNYNFVETIHFELLCNSTTTIAMTSSWDYYFHPFIKIWQMAIWIVSDSKIIFFLNYLSPLPIMIVNDVMRLSHVA